MLDTRAYTEIYEIIKAMPKDMKKKIPENILKNIENRKDLNYNFKFDKYNIEDVEFLEDTKKILSVLYTDYFASEEEKEIILNKEKILKNKKISNNEQSKEITENKTLEENIELKTQEKIESSDKLSKKIIKFLKIMLEE